GFWEGLQVAVGLPQEWWPQGLDSGEPVEGGQLEAAPVCVVMRQSKESAGPTLGRGGWRQGGLRQGKGTSCSCRQLSPGHGPGRLTGCGECHWLHCCGLVSGFTGLRGQEEDDLAFGLATIGTTETAPSCVGDMADTPRDAGLKQVPAPRSEKAPVDFGYVGIDSILEQMRRKAMKQGFEFNIMVVGQSGLGKSTLINTLFKSKISRKSVQPPSEERIPKTIEIKSITHDIEEKGVRMKLTVIDTPGFGDHINNENCWQPIMKFINDQYEKYLQEEVNINRKKRIPDTRVHCCLYFIPATGHSLRPLDIEFMKRLSKVVNIVPVIAKADTLTLEERVHFKQRITADLLSNGIDVYPQKEFDEDSEDRLVNEKFREMIPFAVVGSDHEYQVNGKRILGRKTKWGTIEVENTTHCEFAYLRDLLIRTHMQNIKDITSSIHFEAYRVKRLNEGSSAMANGVEEKEPEAPEM
uniref:Septin 9 n=1 Tax=Cercocebus atys TaxID=9531 RepID=A0A2K5LG08_CERAT